MTLVPLLLVVPEDTFEKFPPFFFIFETDIVSPSGSLSFVNTSPVVPVDPSDAETDASSLTEFVLFVADGSLFPELPPVIVISSSAVVVASPSEIV